MPNLAEKDSYDELTERQKEIVDTAVENPNLNDSNILRQCDALNGNGWSVLRQYSHIIERRRQENQAPITALEQEAEEPGQEATANGEEQIVVENGNNRFEGNPIDATWQYLSERPTEPETSTVNVSDNTLTVCFEFRKETVQSIVSDLSAPSELRKQVMNELVNEAFEQ